MSEELSEIFGDTLDIPLKPLEINSSNHDFILKPRGASTFREKYRPQRFDEIVPTCSIEQLKNQVDNPGASQIFLMEGRSGTGKTTAARILARALICNAKNTYDKPCLTCNNCQIFDHNPIDVLELNTADKNKTDDARSLISDMQTMSAQLPKKIYILDEVQRLTKDAQQVLLTVFEEPHHHLLIFLCTTDISKLDKALIHRTCRISFSDLTPKHALSVINQVFKYEKLSASPEIKEELYARSQGSIRALLNNIEAYAQHGFNAINWEETEVSAEVKLLYQAISTGDWPNLSNLLVKTNVKKDSEALRIGLENYFRAVLLKKTNMEEAVKYGNALLRLSGSLDSETSGLSVYNSFVVKCLRACNIFKS